MSIALYYENQEQHSQDDFGFSLKSIKLTCFVILDFLSRSKYLNPFAPDSVKTLLKTTVLTANNKRNLAAFDLSLQHYSLFFKEI